MSELNKRIKNISKELNSLNSDIKSKEDAGSHPGVFSIVDTLDNATKENDMTSDALRLAQDQTGGRGNLPSYLSANMQPPARLLRRERKVQRNKAIVMCVFVLVVLFLVIYMFLT
ncbi:MAG: hypothetical protein KAI74_03460 [Kiritimatiellae bacterium]|nr:hypothetical protein [Kiritimatiellia bacterium]